MYCVVIRKLLLNEMLELQPRLKGPGKSSAVQSLCLCSVSLGMWVLISPFLGTLFILLFSQIYLIYSIIYCNSFIYFPVGSLCSAWLATKCNNLLASRFQIHRNGNMIWHSWAGVCHWSKSPWSRSEIIWFEYKQFKTIGWAVLLEKNWVSRKLIHFMVHLGPMKPRLQVAKLGHICSVLKVVWKNDH